MLAGIGFILIFKQFPHAIGYDVELFGADNFSGTEEENTFTRLINSIEHIEWGAFIISIVSLGILILWSRTRLSNFRWLPAALVVILLSVFLNEGFKLWVPELSLKSDH